MRTGTICPLRRTLVLMGVLLLAASGSAFAQLQTGDLYGTVDGDGEPLPGVTVTLSGVGAPRVQVTDATGQYRFLSLPPGQYQLLAALDGFSTVEYPNLTIQVGGKTEINVTLNAAVEEVITVTAESPLLDERKLNRGTNVSVEELDKIPTARDPWSLLSQAPGVAVDRINVGGSESGQQSVFVGNGASTTQHTFAVDGVIVTDMAAVGASYTYFDFGAFEEVQFTVGSADVGVAVSGVTVNQVTRRGGNEWAFRGRYLRTDWQSAPEAGRNEIDAVEEYGVDIGGPLWKDHLWIWAAYGESDIGKMLPGPEGLTLDRTQLEDLNGKINFQAGSNSGVVHYWKNDKLKAGRGAGPDRSPETLHDQTTPAKMWKIDDTHVFGNNFFVTGLYGHHPGKFTLAPRGGHDADIYWDAEGVLHGSYWDYFQDATIDQARLEGSYFFNTGGVSHELKFGAGWREQENTSGTIWSHGKLVYACEAWGCDPSGNNAFVKFARDKAVGISSTYESAWIQDTLTVGKLTFNAGLRYQNQTTKNLPSTSLANPALPDVIPELAFPGNDAGGFEWETISPRIGATYAVNEGKTLLRGTFSQYAEQLGQSLAQRVNPLGYAYAYFYFTDANGNLVLDGDEYGSLYYYYYYNIDPSDPLATSSLNVNDPDLDPTLTDELTFSVEHSFKPEFVGGVTLTYRNISDIPETRQLVIDAAGNVRPATSDDYVFVGTTTGTPPNGQTASAPYYRLSDELSGYGEYYTNGQREQDYLGITLSATKRLANRWSLRGHFTWNDWEWKVGDDYWRNHDPTDIVSNPDTYSNEGATDGQVVGEVSSGSGNKDNVWIQSGWQFNVYGLYQVAPERPWAFNLCASITGREGFPSPVYSPAAGKEVQLAPIGTFRHSNIYYLDARIDKDFDFGDLGLTLSLDGFNLLNEDVVLQRERNLGVGIANEPGDWMDPRVFRVGLKLTWK
ncbi:MAG: TonB-dependent receptor [bacterium]|nr:TonB-dependent receptor [bacterium]